MSDTPTPSPIIGHFADDWHALKTGMLIGSLMKAGIPVQLVLDDQGNYIPRMAVELPSLDDLTAPIEVWIKVLSGPDSL